MAKVGLLPKAKGASLQLTLEETNDLECLLEFARSPDHKQWINSTQRMLAAGIAVGLRRVLSEHTKN